jgi:hypothetical protein
VTTEKNPVKDRREMVGDFFREAAALVLVFAFLDKVIFDKPITYLYTGGVVVLSISLLLYGMSLERRRRR